MNMLLQSMIILMIIGINNARQDIAEYLRQHSDLTEVTEQFTTIDRNPLPADKDLTYPVEGHPVPEIKVDLWGKGEKRNKRPKIRARRQISSDSCYLFFANRVHLIQFQNSPTFRLNVVLTGFNNTVAVDFDKRDNLLFWSDVALKRIYRSYVNGSSPTILVDSNITTPDGLAWDWVNKKLYWTDYGDKDLEVKDLRTGCRKQLFQFSDTSKPRAIVLDPGTGWMYWTDWGSPAKIDRASMDGTNHNTLHTTNLWWPNALTMDYDTQTLYWLDAGTDRMEMSNADGSNRVLLSLQHIYHPFGATYYQGALFWSDWHLNAILSATLSDPSTVYITFGNLTLDPMGVVAACDDKQANITNRCDGHCNNLCLLSSNSHGYTCTCPESCDSGASGDNAECAVSCGENAECTGHNQCTCKKGWRGHSCDKGVCTGGCVYGECVAPGVCDCDDGWTGERCDQAVCCSECGQGSCTSPGTCTCDEGWEGDKCETQTCLVSGGCLNGGSCKTSVCECPPGYDGPRCEKLNCNSFIQTC